MTFGEVFDRERAAWCAGHGGSEDGCPIEGVEGQRLRWAWEDAHYDLSELWGRYSRLPLPLTRLGRIAETGQRLGSSKLGRVSPISLGFWP